MKTNKLKQIYNSSACVYIGSFLLSTLLMALVLLGNSIYPGSTRTLLISDMREQYMPFLASLRYLGRGDNSIFFNWSHSLGGNYLGLFAYYLASPLSWITLLFDLPSMPEAIYVLTLLKIGLCGLTFSIFLNRGVAKKPNQPLIILFACCYALMSYNVLYSLCIMWLDEIILFPLVLLGIERLLEGRKGGLYLMSIALCFFANYYLSYMIGIFSAIYFVYRLICQWSKGSSRDSLRAVARFVVNTILGIGIVMPLLLPAILDLGTGRTLMEKNKHYIVFNFNFWKVFTKLTSSQYDTIKNLRSLPSLFCGTVMIFLTLAYFIQKNHARREKLGAFAILSFLLLSFWWVPLDKAWHGFQFPSWFPYRYAFTFSTMMLLLSYQAIEQLDITQYKIGPLVYRILCVFTLVELFFNGSNVIGGLDKECFYTLRFDYEDVVLPTEKLVETVKGMDNGLYRVDKDYQLGLNDSMFFDYNSLTHSSSTFHYMADQFTAKLGLAQLDWWNMNYGSTLLTDSLFGVKYRFAENPMPREWIAHDKETWYTLYENPYALPIGYLVDASCADAPIDWTDDPFTNQNLLLQQLSGTNVTCFVPVASASEYTEDDLTITFTAPNDGAFYLRIRGGEIKLSDEEQIALEEWLENMDAVEASNIRKERESKLYVNDENRGNYFDPMKNCNLYLGTFTAGEEVKIHLVHNGLATVDDYYLTTLDTSALTDTLVDMSKGGLKITSHGSGAFSGTVTAADNQALFTSIPYDHGFTVKVDGVKTAYTSFADTFLIIPLPAGAHEISISYLSPGVLPGCMIAIIAILLVSIYYLVLPRKSNNTATTQ